MPDQKPDQDLVPQEERKDVPVEEGERESFSGSETIEGVLEEIEEKIRTAVPHSSVDTHLEPIEDPVSWEDTRLERK